MIVPHDWIVAHNKTKLCYVVRDNPENHLLECADFDGPVTVDYRDVDFIVDTFPLVIEYSRFGTPIPDHEVDSFISMNLHKPYVNVSTLNVINKVLAALWAGKLRENSVWFYSDRQLVIPEPLNQSQIFLIGLWLIF